MAHIDFADLQDRLKRFSKARKKTLSAIVKYAIETYLFTLEGDDPKRDLAIRTAIDRRFSVPKNIPYTSFYVFLYMLAKKYPNQSSNSFWTQTICTAHTQLTHLEIFNDIQKDLEGMLNGSNKN